MVIHGPDPRHTFTFAANPASDKILEMKQIKKTIDKGVRNIGDKVEGIGFGITHGIEHVRQVTACCFSSDRFWIH